MTGWVSGILGTPLVVSTRFSGICTFHARAVSKQPYRTAHID